ncbi:MAG TPA: hypothetical protein VKU00_14755 [Chthonomonadaceae bacterium]|nr:hypothetical protein [Chthonomonadaceae bacterium]
MRTKDARQIEEVGTETIPVEELDKVEGYKMLDEQTQKILGMSAAEFIAEYEAGHLTNGVEDTRVTHLAMLIPFAK